MIINHNMSAMNAHRQLSMTNSNSKKNIEKLSSGYRINRAGDDAAGLSISEKMRAQIKGLGQASRNSQDGISLIQTAEGALDEVHSILQRTRELAVQATNDTNTETDRKALQGEIDQLTTEIDRIANTTEFNTKKLLNGNITSSKSFEAGILKVENTFANGAVRVTAGDVYASQVATTDVLRLKVIKDWTDAVISSSAFSVTSVLGNIAVSTVYLTTGIMIEVSGVVGTGSRFSDGGLATDTMTFDISNLNGLKAGDVITITVGQAQGWNANHKGLTLQIGANGGQEMDAGINDMSSNALKLRAKGNALSVASKESASGAVELFNLALEKVSTQRSKLGAVQNRLEHTIKNLDISAENLQASESRIRDVDMAKEMMEYSKNNILTQAAQSMLAQANQSTQGVLKLLQ